MSLEAALARVALHQYGLFTLDQAVESGLSRSVIARRLASGDLDEPQPHVLRASTTPYGAAAAAAAALLSAGPLALLSHTSAAAVWELGPRLPTPHWVTLPFRHRLPRLRDVEVVRSRYTAGIGRSRAGLAVTSPARTYVDLGRVLARAELESALATATQRGLLRLREVEDVLAVAHHRAGTQLARDVLRHFDPAWESILSARLGRLLRSAALVLHPGYVVRDRDGEVVAVADFAEPRARLAAEADGWAFHGSQSQQQHDRARDRRLLALGWVTVRFTTDDILRRPAQVVNDVRQVLAGRSFAAPAA